MQGFEAHNLVRQIALALCVLAVPALLVIMAMPPSTQLTHGHTSMLMIHLLMELFAVIIAMLVVIVSWHTFDTQDARSANALICGFLIVASSDLLHALTYEGMPYFLSESNTPRAIFFWLMGRTFEVATMFTLAFNWALTRSRRSSLLLGLAVSCVLVWFGSYDIDKFPATFIQGQGVTPFKAFFEISLSLLYITIAIVFWQRAKRSDQLRNYLLAASCFLTGIGEVSFTAYVAPSDFQNIFGHIYKLAAYALLYRATFIANIRTPIEALRQSENRLRESEERAISSLRELHYQTFAFDQHAIVAMTDVQGTITYVNEKFCEISGYTQNELLGQNHRLLNSGTHSKDFFRDLYRTIAEGKVWDGEICNRAKDGSLYWVMTTIVPYLDNNGKPYRYVAIRNDITLRKQAEETINQLAFYDSLTQLPNRRLLRDRLLQAFSMSARNGQFGAVLYIDLDHFKIINDTKGHTMGDQLLIQVAKRLTSCIRDGDTVSRLGGDEFLVVLASLSTNADEATLQAAMIAEKIRSTLGESYTLEEFQYLITLSIGIVMFRGHQESIEDLLRYADTAMYQAKASGRNTVCFYDADMQADIETRAALANELRHAITKQQFLLHYQIQVGNRNQPIGAEVLLRWEHPEFGLIPPFQFIPLAEETGLIIPIGIWILQTACAQLRMWQHDPLTRDLTLAVNVSAKQFRQADFIEQVQQILLKSGARSSHLKLELTESTVLEDIDDTVTKMRALKSLGVSFSMDDFGTGFSSLQYLKRLPLDQIKIDQSFVRDITTDSNDAAIVQAIIAITEAMGLNVIAEGVETLEQQKFLDLHGCHAFQGYLFSKPIPLDDFTVFLKSQNR
jgi:diguanylate cyclase (GGDEF)-like protein/PAS domain S-box-containing protein